MEENEVNSKNLFLSFSLLFFIIYNLSYLAIDVDFYHSCTEILNIERIDIVGFFLRINWT